MIGESRSDGNGLDLFSDGQMGALMRSMDWSKTEIGAVESWPQSLRTAVSICLASRFPILIWWGPRLVKIYNDAYATILGDKHPSAMGRPGQEVWPEIWSIIGPMLEGVLQNGQATWSDDQLLLLERHGFPEECYFTFTYSPIRDESGGIGGVFCAVIETTPRVIGERQLATLRELVARTSVAKSVDESVRAALETLRANPNDVPFAALYLSPDESGPVRLAGAVGLVAGSPAAPFTLDPGAPDQAWPLDQVRATGDAVLVSSLTSAALDRGADDAPLPRTALALPIAGVGRENLVGMLVVGLSARRPLDDGYRDFAQLIARNVATALANARSYEEERQRAAALTELDRAKTAFFSNVSHEFRTPLTLILGPLERALAQSDDLPSSQRQRLELARRNALRLTRLVNTLLDFSRFEAGRAEAVYQPTDLALLTSELASGFRSAIESAGLQFEVNCSPLAQPVYVDRDMWEKIVLNLLSNAFKFTLQGRIAVELAPTGSGVALVVRDTGVGIPDREIPRVFERFHRVRVAEARTHEGTGIGLTLVQELVRLHGGTVRVESTVGVGTTFTVEIPLGTSHLPPDRVEASYSIAPTTVGVTPFVEEALRWLPVPSPTRRSGDLETRAREIGGIREGPEPAPAERREETERARILLVDDNADMREYVHRLLEDRWTVEACSDGASALDVARRRAPDLVLADVMMPGLDGFELLRALRADPATRSVPVILLSARAGEEARVDGLEAGADDYLTKPFAARELLARVATHLELAALRGEVTRAERRARLDAERYAARLDALLSNLGEAVLIADASGRVVLRSAAARDLFGWDDRTLETILRDGAPILLRPDERPLPHQEWPMVRALRGEPFSGLETILVLPDGSRRFLLNSGAAVRDENGSVELALVVARDVTRERDLEQVREDYVSLISHDLRIPVTAARAGAQLVQRMLRRQGLELEAGRLDLVVANTERMDRMIQDLAESGRWESGQVELRPVPTHPVRFVEAILDRLGSGPERDRIRLEAPAIETRVLVDPERIERAILNLITNALKYSDAPVVVRVAEDGGDVVVEVADRGPGVAPEELPRLFDRFYRSSAAGGTEGLGLGLYITRLIAEAHGGRVGVQSRLGEGATFSLRLPPEPPAPP